MDVTCHAVSGKPTSGPLIDPEKKALNGLYLSLRLYSSSHSLALVAVSLTDAGVSARSCLAQSMSRVGHLQPLL